MVLNENYHKTLFGIILCLVTALFAIKLSKIIGINVFQFEKSPISPIIIAILFGLSVNNKLISLVYFEPGFKYCIKYILKIGIIFLGIRLSLLDFMKYGSISLLIVIPCILLTITIVDILRKKIGVSNNLSLLIAVGTSICGATAIVALAPSINAKKPEITYAIANITVFGLLAMFLYPILAHILFSNDLSSGLFLGSSIHDTALVAGSAMIYADQYSRQDVIGIATLTKLVRNTLMVVVIPYLAHKSLSRKNNFTRKIFSIFPYFIFGFLSLGIVRTYGDYYFLEYYNNINQKPFIIWETFKHSIQTTAEFLLIVSMAAVGFNTNLKSFKELGVKPFYLGFITASIVGIFCTLMIKIIV